MSARSIPLLVAVLGVASGACTPTAARQTAHPKVDVLSSMGFALTDDGDPTTSSGTLAATFQAPVVGIDDPLETAGSAHAAFDDGERDLASAAIIGAYPETDIVYAVLFEPDAPWRYVVVAAHAAELVAGADIALDGQAAAALVVDENTGSGFLSQSGSLHVDAADLQSGGTLSGSASADLVEVGLASWPESLFPFSNDGQPTERAAAAGGGTFSATYSANGTAAAAGTASVTVDVAGQPTFAGIDAQASMLDDQDTVIVINEAGGRRILALFIENSALTAGGTMSLGGYVAGASLFAEDGSQAAFVDGTLTIDGATLTEGGTIAGSFAVTGDAYLVAADASGSGPGDPNQTEDCTGIDSLASTFTPAQASLEAGIPADQMPAGFDKVLTLTDSGSGMLSLLVPTDIDLHSGAPYAFTTVDYQGRPFPAGVFVLATCSQWVEVESGTLTATLDDAAGTLTGSLDYTVAGQARTLTFALSMLPQ